MNNNSNPSNLNNRAMAKPLISKFVKSGLSKNTQSNNFTQTPLKPKKKDSFKYILGGVALLLLIVGSAAALSLTQQGQDLRNQAKIIYTKQTSTVKEQPIVKKQVSLPKTSVTTKTLPKSPIITKTTTPTKTKQVGTTYKAPTTKTTPTKKTTQVGTTNKTTIVTKQPDSPTSTTPSIGGTTYFPSTPVSCNKGSLCNCAPNDLCVPIGGSGDTYQIDGGQYNGQTCFINTTSFRCVQRETTETIAVGGIGDSCEIGQRTACGNDGGCPSGQQKICTGSGGLGACTWTDRCIGDSDRGNGEVTQDQSCAGVKRVSGGEPSRGGFIGCSGSLNCFCTQSGVSTGQTYSGGSVVCYEDLHNDSCGAPGVGGTTPTTSTPTESTPPSTNPPESTPPPTTPPTNYYCDSTCETDSQCQTSDSNFTCNTTEGNRCRLASNPTSTECQPAVGPMCLDIDLVDSQTGTPLTDDPSYGDAVKFTCGEVANVDHYIFRVIEPDDNIVSLSATGRTSSLYTIAKAGKFYAQCQICTSSDDSSCNSFEALN